MLILLRQIPDNRIQELILSILKTDPETNLVYLEHSFQEIGSLPPLILPERTFSMDPPPNQNIIQLDSKGLLDLIHSHPKSLILP